MTLENRIGKWLKDTSKQLDISGLWLKEWPKELEGKEHLVESLYCPHNKLKSLPDFLNLTVLFCYNNQLKSLPNFLNLTYLDCGNNQLKLLPNFLKLTKLYCDYNQLKSLPKLPNLTNIYCLNNQLFSNSLKKWHKMWKLQKLRRLDLRKRGLNVVIKRMKLRLYLPRLTNLHRDLIYSPNHPGKFYKLLRLGDWSGESNVLKKPSK